MSLAVHHPTPERPARATLAIADIRVGDRHRRELGDIAALAESLKSVGLLHPPVVTDDRLLVCGFRRLEAAKRLGWARIEVRVVRPDDLLAAERDENEVRKDFTPSERVAIAREIEARLGDRRGRRTDKELVQNIAQVEGGRAGKGDKQLPHNCAEVRPGQETRDVASKAAGFKNRETYRRAAKVVDKGSPKLKEAMDAGSVSIAAAAEVADLPSAEQEAVAAAGPKAVRAKAAEVRAGRSLVNGVEADDPPDVAALRAAGKIAPGVVVEVVEPGPPAETAATPEPEPSDADATDEQWLATLPARGHLDGAQRKTFDADALVYRRLEPARKTFAHHASRAVNAAGRRQGEYGYRVTRFLATDHPRHWLVCPRVEDGGCGGTGNVPLIGRCPKCRGKGYWIK